MREYSREEVELFYEKCVKQDMRKMADQIESTAAGIGMSFSKSNKMNRIIKELRE